MGSIDAPDVWITDDDNEKQPEVRDYEGQLREHLDELSGEILPNKDIFQGRFEYTVKSSDDAGLFAILKGQYGKGFPTTKLLQRSYLHMTEQASAQQEDGKDKGTINFIAPGDKILIVDGVLSIERKGDKHSDLVDIQIYPWTDPAKNLEKDETDEDDEAVEEDIPEPNPDLDLPLGEDEIEEPIEEPIEETVEYADMPTEAEVKGYIREHLKDITPAYSTVAQSRFYVEDEKVYFNSSSFGDDIHVPLGDGLSPQDQETLVYSLDQFFDLVRTEDDSGYEFGRRSNDDPGDSGDTGDTGLSEDDLDDLDLDEVSPEIDAGGADEEVPEVAPEPIESEYVDTRPDLTDRLRRPDGKAESLLEGADQMENVASQIQQRTGVDVDAEDLVNYKEFLYENNRSNDYAELVHGAFDTQSNFADMTFNARVEQLSSYLAGTLDFSEPEVVEAEVVDEEVAEGGEGVGDDNGGEGVVVEEGGEGEIDGIIDDLDSTDTADGTEEELGGEIEGGEQDSTEVATEYKEMPSNGEVRSYIKNHLIGLTSTWFDDPFYVGADAIYFNTAFDNNDHKVTISEGLSPEDLGSLKSTMTVLLEQMKDETNVSESRDARPFTSSELSDYVLQTDIAGLESNAVALELVKKTLEKVQDKAPDVDLSAKQFFITSNMSDVLYDDMYVIDTSKTYVTNARLIAEAMSE